MIACRNTVRLGHNLPTAFRVEWGDLNGPSQRAEELNLAYDRQFYSVLVATGQRPLLRRTVYTSYPHPKVTRGPETSGPAAPVQQWKLCGG